MEIAAVLWDADGVLQQGPTSTDPFVEVLGERAEEFGALVWGRLDDALAGRLHMADHVTAALEQLGLADRREQVLALWDLLTPLPAPRAVVAAVRETGFGCYLATNQDDLRAAAMRRLLGYDELLDASFYSCDLGVAKPSPDYFLAVADALVLAPEQLLFVDDNLENVEGARDTGLYTIHWTHTDGVEVLMRRLGVHGIRI
ncbi:HAD family hydrolase [Nocardioides mangrovicus]|uniref:HAD family hydrolase n=1 Tax=Nocardioides mangrovicus TaxID=2478913 RepID=A0A3L8P0S3_9ACTN|nr:HAD-IA family hydrolase [Nocardioides mangrovicus]RLV48517.1 HAD family hydrolase [Nocardioides mangrovicus]